MCEEYTRISRTMKGGDIIDAIDRQHYHALAEQILGMGTKILLIKAGHQGAYLATGNVTSLNSTARMNLSLEQWNSRQVWCEPFPVEPGRVRNTCGAGDCAVAAFLTAILNGENPNNAGKYAMLAGRNNLYSPDSVQQLQDWSAMKRQIEQMQA
jgi:sugar/nucleoside kinase (ribokinase family)